jgi:hypothetical protein
MSSISVGEKTDTSQQMGHELTSPPGKAVPLPSSGKSPSQSVKPPTDGLRCGK